MIVLAIILFSLCIGSFLNVVIHRYPKMLEKLWQQEAQDFLHPENLAAAKSKQEHYNLAFPASHCPHCQHALRWWHNIPLLSFLLLKGRCAFCQKSIACQYPLVEGLATLIALISYQQFGFSYMGLATTLFGWALLVQSSIDAKHQFLPDLITYATLWAALLASTQLWFNLSPALAIWGAAFGFFILWAIATIFKLLRKKEGMGQGDFKLLAAIGAWTGPQMIPFILIVASLLSLVYSLLKLAQRKIQKDTPLPFGPFLSLAGWLLLLFGKPLIQLWLGS